MHRLGIIRRRLAVLTIKKFWRKKRLTLKIIKDRIFKIKRRILAKKNKEAFEKYLETLGGLHHLHQKSSEKSPVVSPTLVDLTGSDLPPPLELLIKSSSQILEKKNADEDKILQEEESMRLMIQQRLEYLITKGKLAHGLKFVEPKQIVPVIYEKTSAIAQAMFTDGNTARNLRATTASTFAKGRSGSRQKSVRTRSLAISSPRTVETKKHFEMTEGFSRLSFCLPDEGFVEHSSRKFVRPVEVENFLEPTETFSVKIRKKYRGSPVRQIIVKRPKRAKKLSFPPSFKYFSEAKQSQITLKGRGKKQGKQQWVPVARSTSTYIPGLENPAFPSEKLSPRDFTSKIFTTFPKSACKSREKTPQTHAPASPLQFTNTSFQFHDSILTNI